MQLESFQIGLPKKFKIQILKMNYCFPGRVVSISSILKCMVAKNNVMRAIEHLIGCNLISESKSKIFAQLKWNTIKSSCTIKAF